MANLKVLDGDGNAKYLKAAGAGTDGDPFILERSAAVTIGAALPAGTNNIGDVDVASIAAGENHLGEVGGKMVKGSVEFTRPADTTAYTAGDVVSDSASASTLMDFASFARTNGGGGYIVAARLLTDKKSTTPRMRVHLFNAANPTVAADNAAHKEIYADASKRMGYFDLPAMSTPVDTTNSDQSRSIDMNLRFPFVTGGSTRSVYALLEALDAFTPASGEKFTLVLTGELN